MIIKEDKLFCSLQKWTQTIQMASVLKSALFMILRKHLMPKSCSVVYFSKRKPIPVWLQSRLLSVWLIIGLNFDTKKKKALEVKCISNVKWFWIPHPSNLLAWPQNACIFSFTVFILKDKTSYYFNLLSLFEVNLVFSPTSPSWSSRWLIHFLLNHVKNVSCHKPVSHIELPRLKGHSLPLQFHTRCWEKRETWRFICRCLRHQEGPKDENAIFLVVIITNVWFQRQK